jgi:hypothetical protein
MHELQINGPTIFLSDFFISVVFNNACFYHLGNLFSENEQSWNLPTAITSDGNARMSVSYTFIQLLHIRQLIYSMKQAGISRNGRTSAANFKPNLQWTLCPL